MKLSQTLPWREVVEIARVTLAIALSSSSDSFSHCY